MLTCASKGTIKGTPHTGTQGRVCGWSGWRKDATDYLTGTDRACKRKGYEKQRAKVSGTKEASKAIPYQDGPVHRVKVVRRGSGKWDSVMSVFRGRKTEIKTIFLFLFLFFYPKPMETSLDDLSLQPQF